MSTIGKKISELENDDYVSGKEKIPVSDNGVTKFLTIEQILKSVTAVNAAKTTEHEIQQQESIESNKADITEIKEIINNIPQTSDDVWETFNG